MRNVIFNFDPLNTCIVSIRESCVLVKGCSMFHFICLIHFSNNVHVPVFFFVIQLSTLCLHFVSLSDLKEFFKIKTATSNVNEVSEKVCETKQCKIFFNDCDC